MLSSHKGPAVRIRICARDNTFKHKVIPSKTSANRRRTVRLHSRSGAHCLKGNILGTMTGMGSVVTSTVLNFSMHSRLTVSGAVVSLSNAPGGRGLNTGTVLTMSVTMTRTTTSCLSVPLCRCLNKFGTGALPAPVVGVVGNKSRSSTPVTFRRFVVLPINTPSFGRTLH